MRNCLAWGCLALALPALVLAQQPPAKDKASQTKLPSNAAADSSLKEMFEAKIKAEWEAIKNKDKKAYGDLLADDYEGVEVDNRGERTRIQAINELVNGNIYKYTLWGFKFTPLGPDAAFLIYEVTMEFPPKSVVRFSRVYITELWVKRAGQWKMLHYQETHVK
jgi:Domain of unknown function (DUF4440)